MKATIKREDGKVWLEGVSGWSAGDKESSIHAAQEAIMQAAGHDVAYDYLVGVSSLAFRMQVHKKGLCPSSPHSFCGFQCVGRSVQALPLSIRVYEVKAKDAAGVAEARAAVVESIERGVPVQYGSEEDGIIVGYQKDGAEWLCLHPNREGGKTTFVETSWPWGVAVFGDEKEELASRHMLAIGAVSQAVDMAGGGPEANGYYVGFRAWDEYLATLKKLLASGADVRKNAMLGNAWIYECLAQHRACAATYLREIVSELSDDAAAHLCAAAMLYEKMAAEVLRDDDHCVVDIAPYPWALKKGAAWTDEQLGSQIERLEAALPIEHQAIGELESALPMM